MRAPLLKHHNIIHLARLLDMLYKPAELAEEINVNVDTIYRCYLPAGMPYFQDENGHYWIHGPAFVSWARQTISLKKSKRQPLAENQAWCLKCDQPVEILHPRKVYQNRYIQILQAACPRCGGKINRAAKIPLPEFEEVGNGLGGAA